MYNTIIVIRSSNTHNVNQKLRDALMGHYRNDTPMYPITAGGIISHLITEHTLQEIVDIVKAADCGDNVTIVDVHSPTMETITIMAGLPDPTLLPKDKVTSEINRLLSKRQTSTLSEEEETYLAKLLDIPA